MTPLDDGQDVHADDGFNPGAGITPVNQIAAPGLSTLDPSLTGSITVKLMNFTTGPSLPEKTAEIAGLLHDFFSLPLQERTPTEHKAWVKKILDAVGIEEQPFSLIPDNQYPDHAFALARFIEERQYMMMKVPDQLSSPSTPTAESTPFSPRDQFASLDRRLRGMAQNGGDLAPPLMNRRSTDPKTPPTALADTNTVKETQGPLTLLHSFLSKIMPKKSDQASQVDPQQAAASSNADKPQDRSNSPRLK